MSDVALIWITRKSKDEDAFIKRGLDRTQHLHYQKIIVGHTDLTGDFDYLPFYEHGLDDMGLICHKKNLGILACEARVALVLHADMIPDVNFLNEISKLRLTKNEFYAPLAFTDTGERALTWCSYAGQHKAPEEPETASTYISGGAILSLTENFRHFRWNQNLRHNMEEDWELSRRIRSYGGYNKCAQNIRLTSLGSQ